ncbi:lipopolysaccharide assembly protein LapA domain-containing protein, partial [Bacillus subtilis]
QFPAGVTYLICAISGALIMALVGGWRMFELRRQVRKQARR